MAKRNTGDDSRQVAGVALTVLCCLTAALSLVILYLGGDGIGTLWLALHFLGVLARPEVFKNQR